MKAKHALALVLAILIVLSSGWATAQQPDADKAKTVSISLKSYDVSLVRFDKPMEREIHGRKVKYTQGYIIRLHGSFPSGTAEVMELFVGEEPIEEYGGLPDGVYFLILEGTRLYEMQGQPFRYRFGKGEIQNFKQKFEPKKFMPFKPKSLQQALAIP